MFKDFNIAQIGHPILRNKTKDIPINDIKSNNTQKIIEKMIKTMRQHNGAGLAANQIYEPIRICIIEVLDNPRYKHLNIIPLKVLINPKIFIKKDLAHYIKELNLNSIRTLVHNIDPKIKIDNSLVFNELNYRNQLIYNLNNLKIYNDSKCTNLNNAIFKNNLINSKDTYE